MSSDIPEDPEREEWLRSLDERPEVKPKKKDRPKVEPIIGMSLQLGSHVELGKRLIGVLGGPDKVVFDHGFIHVYDERSGLWVQKPEAEIGRILHTFDGADVAGKPIRLRNSDVCGARKRAEEEAADDKFFAQAPHGICFRDEFVRLENGIILREQHNREHRCRAGLDFDFTPGAAHPKLDEFWSVIFGDCEETERTMRVAMLQEFMGACMFGLAPHYQNCLCLLGKGDNGKSAVLRIVESVFPRSAVSSLTPQLWGMRFQIIALVGSLVNICNEIPEQEILAGASFKGIITGDPTPAEIKHGATFSFTPRAGHIFSANAMPGTRDHSKGFFRRWNILLLSRDLRALPCHKVDAAKDVIDAERAAIAAWAIEGASRLQRVGHYTVPPSSELAKEEWQQSVDSVQLFVAERCDPANRDRTVNATNGTTSEELYREYKSWCVGAGHVAPNRNNFARRLEAAGYPRVKQADNRYFPLVLKSTGGWGP